MAGVVVTVIATTMEGLPAVDSNVTVKIDEELPSSQLLGTSTVADFNGRVWLNMAMPDSVETEWLVTPNFTRYLAPGGQFFRPVTEPAKTMAFQLTRDPAQWQPRFSKLGQLGSPRFDPFKKVVGVSKSVDLKLGPAIGDLSADYDVLDNGAQLLAKTALLNLFAVLTDEVDPIGKVAWFSYVQKIVRMDQERFLGEVDKDLFDHVLAIVDGLNGVYRGMGYSTEPEADLALHTPNIPPQYDVKNNLQKIGTLKKSYEQGNVQWTVSCLKRGDGLVYLLDCDMDEHLEIIAHAADIGEHVVTGGTSPILMHEYIVRDSAQQAADGVSTIDLGYVLVAV